MRLGDRVVLLAGGAGSIDSAVARLFAQEGARETARTIVDAGGQYMSVVLYLCNAQVWDEAVNAKEKNI